MPLILEYFGNTFTTQWLNNIFFSSHHFNKLQWALLLSRNLQTVSSFQHRYLFISASKVTTESKGLMFEALMVSGIAEVNKSVPKANKVLLCKLFQDEFGNSQFLLLQNTRFTRGLRSPRGFWGFIIGLAAENRNWVPSERNLIRRKSICLWQQSIWNGYHYKGKINQIREKSDFFNNFYTSNSLQKRTELKSGSSMQCNIHM